MANNHASNARTRKKRLAGTEREIIKHRLAIGYLEGRTLQELVDEYRMTYGVVRRLVLDAGVVLRPTGASRVQNA